jgi:hypothetical protein
MILNGLTRGGDDLERGEGVANSSIDQMAPTTDYERFTVLDFSLVKACLTRR